VPAGDGRIGLVSKGDVGRCLAALARRGPTGRCHEVTGPAALDAAAIAATAAQAWVRPVAYRPISAAAYMAQAAATEDPWWLYAYTSMFASIREQRWDRVTAEVQHLTGRDPRHLGEILDETTPSADAR
jgi:NAD(P)H dehydrogenase (quinone)